MAVLGTDEILIERGGTLYKAPVSDLPAGDGSGGAFSFCQVRNTDTTTDINVATAADIPFGGTTDATDDDYTLAASSITVNFEGIVNVQAHISQESADERTNVGIWITKNNTQMSGVGKSGYIRAASDHNDSSSHMSATFAVADGDVIRVRGERRGAGQAVAQTAGESQVTVERRGGASSNLSVSENLTAGFSSDIEAVGTISTGTYTPAIGDAQENIKSLTNGGAFTLAVPATNGPISIQVTNNASAGAITFASGYQKVGGDDLTTTDGHDFFIHIIRIGAFASVSVEALQ